MTTTYTLARTVRLPYAEAVEATRAALTAQGFGILTEIDLATTLKDKLGVDVAPQVILGACRPPLAYEAVRAEPSIAAMLPCNVVVRGAGESTTVVETFDPEAMMTLTASPAVRSVVTDARSRLTAALAVLEEHR